MCYKDEAEGGKEMAKDKSQQFALSKAREIAQRLL